jgi:hypothetical protein
VTSQNEGKRHRIVAVDLVEGDRAEAIEKAVEVVSYMAELDGPRLRDLARESFQERFRYLGDQWQVSLVLVTTLTP